MKRVLYILVFLMAVGGIQALPVPDNFLPQRIENTATGPAAQGAEGRIVFIAGRRITFIADRGLICRDLCGLCKRFRSFGLILCERNRFAG